MVEGLDDLCDLLCLRLLVTEVKSGMDKVASSNLTKDKYSKS